MNSSIDFSPHQRTSHRNMIAGIRVLDDGDIGWRQVLQPKTLEPLCESNPAVIY
jgi:hypothetical protein